MRKTPGRALERQMTEGFTRTIPQQEFQMLSHHSKDSQSDPHDYLTCALLYGALAVDRERAVA